MAKQTPKDIAERAYFERSAPKTVPAMAAQTTTASHAIVPESILAATEAEVVNFTVRNTGVTNTALAYLVGRLGDGPWVNLGDEVTVATSSSEQLSTADVMFDEYGITIKNGAGATTVIVHGTARDRASGASAITVNASDAWRTLTVTPGAEAGNAIPVVLAQTPAAINRWMAEVYDVDGLQVVVGAYTLAETGAGTEVSTTAKASLIFDTSAGGAATISVTQVVDEVATVYLKLTPLNGQGAAYIQTLTFAGA